LKLSESESFDNILFWGKVEGSTKDYYLAVGLNFRGYYEFPNKRFFWSSSDFSFSELPPLNLEYKDRVDGIRTFFSG